MTQAESLRAAATALRNFVAEHVDQPQLDESEPFIAALDKALATPPAEGLDARDAAAEVVRFYGTDRTWSLTYRTLLGSRIDDLEAALATPPAEGLDAALERFGYYFGETYIDDPITPRSCWLRSDGAGSSVPVSEDVRELIESLLATPPAEGLDKGNDDQRHLPVDARPRG